MRGIEGGESDQTLLVRGCLTLRIEVVAHAGRELADSAVQQRTDAGTPHALRKFVQVTHCIGCSAFLQEQVVVVAQLVAMPGRPTNPSYSVAQRESESNTPQPSFLAPLCRRSLGWEPGKTLVICDLQPPLQLVGRASLLSHRWTRQNSGMAKSETLDSRHRCCLD